MLRKIESGMMRPEWLEYIRDSRLKKIVWVYTPGHAGVKGNERADYLAGSAALGVPCVMGEKEVLIALQEQRDDSAESFTLKRISDLGYRKGGG